MSGGSGIIFWYEDHRNWPKDMQRASSFIQAVALDHILPLRPGDVVEEKSVCKVEVEGIDHKCLVLNVEPERPLVEQLVIVSREKKLLEGRGIRCVAGLHLPAASNGENIPVQQPLAIVPLQAHVPQMAGHDLFATVDRNHMKRSTSSIIPFLLDSGSESEEYDFPPNPVARKTLQGRDGVKSLGSTTATSKKREQVELINLPSAASGVAGSSVAESSLFDIMMANAKSERAAVKLALEGVFTADELVTGMFTERALHSHEKQGLNDGAVLLDQQSLNKVYELVIQWIRANFEPSPTGQELEKSQFLSLCCQTRSVLRRARGLPALRHATKKRSLAS